VRSDDDDRRLQAGPKAIPVDVAIPVYRRAAFIREAVESVVRQTFPHWNLVVCDNGPGGGSIQAAIEPFLADPRISYVATGRTLPLAENWTNAIRQGTAKYVALLNDDDRWSPDFLQDRVSRLEAVPMCGYAFGEWIEIDVDGRESSRAPYAFREGVLSRELLALWFTRQNIVPPSLLIRRSALETVGAAFDERWHYCDWEMWARIAARYPAYYLHRQDCEIRRHPSANTFVRREQPARLVAMMDHIEGLFARELDFRLSWTARHKNRSRILLNAASDVHASGGWRASGALHRRAVLEYPPTLISEASLRMLARSALGYRRAHTLGRRLRQLRAKRLLSGVRRG